MLMMSRSTNRQHRARKEAAIRKHAANYRDGLGKERVKISRAAAAMRRAKREGGE
jgi:hypothetical protein